jgi:hypothetical protein
MSKEMYDDPQDLKSRAEIEAEEDIQKKIDSAKNNRRQKRKE